MTTTTISTPLLALAESLRAEAQHQTASAAARDLAEARAVATEILGAVASLPTDALTARECESLADLAEAAAGEDAQAIHRVEVRYGHSWIGAWTSPLYSRESILPAALLPSCPAAQRIARDSVTTGTCLDCLLPLLTPEERATYDAREAEKEAEEAAREAAAQSQKAAAQGDLDALATWVLRGDPTALAGWRERQIRPAEVTGAIERDLIASAALATVPDYWRNGDDPALVSTVERVSVAAYRRGQEVLAALEATAQRIAADVRDEVAAHTGETAALLPVSVERKRYQRWTRDGEPYGFDPIKRHWTADYRVRIGRLEWLLEGVILD
jgi:hypothetical protein